MIFKRSTILLQYLLKSIWFWLFKIYLFHHLFILLISYFFDALILFVLRVFCSTNSSFLETVFNGVIQSRHLLKRRRMILKPKFASLFWVAYDSRYSVYHIQIQFFEVSIGDLFFSFNIFNY